MSDRIVIDYFDYDQAFSSFKRTYDYMDVAVKFNKALLQRLQDKGLICSGDKPIKVADIGSGPADAIVRFLEDINFKPGFDIRATDINPEYAGKQADVNDIKMVTNQSGKARCVAEENLLKAKNSQVISLHNYLVKQGNAFKSELLNLLSAERDWESEKNTFSLVYASHMLYYAGEDDGRALEDIVSFIDSIATNLLSENGIAVLIHYRLTPRSVNQMLYKYAYHKLKRLTPTNEECCQYSIDYLIESACNQLGLSYYELPFIAKLKFSDKIFEYEEVLKNPSRYSELSNTEVLHDCNRMLFLSHQPANQLYLDKSEFGLTSLVNDTLSIVKEDGCINACIVMKIILSKKATDEFRKEVNSVVQSIQTDLCSFYDTK